MHNVGVRFTAGAGSVYFRANVLKSVSSSANDKGLRRAKTGDADRLPMLTSRGTDIDNSESEGGRDMVSNRS